MASRFKLIANWNKLNATMFDQICIPFVDNGLAFERPLTLSSMGRMADTHVSLANNVKSLCRNGKKPLQVNRFARPLVADDPSSDWRHVDSAGALMTSVYRGCENLGDVWDNAVKKFKDLPCMGTRSLLSGEEYTKDGKKFLNLEFGHYYFDTFLNVNDRISSIAAWLQQIGLKKGDNVVIFAETRADWMQTAIACFKCGLPVITVYATLGEKAVLHALKECDGKIIFTTRNLLYKVAKIVESCPETHSVVYYKELHRVDENDGYATPELMDLFEKMHKKLVPFDALLETAHNSISVAEKPKADDLAVIMYTSGTTSKPKGVMLSHRNIIAAISGQGSVLGLKTNDVYIGYLPLAHVLELCAELIVLSRGASVGYSSAQTLFDRAQRIKKGTKGDCAALRPTLIACVPAVLDQIYKAVTDEVKNLGPLRRKLFHIGYERKQMHYEKGYNSPVMDKLIFNRIRQLLGGNLRGILSGGAPLSEETQRFINTCFCCPVIQGYGLTETCGGATLANMNDVGGLSIGTVGPPLRCCDIRLREWEEAGYSPHNNDNPQGEILIHGDNVALGYFKNDAKTAEDFITIDGKRYFVTGDIGEFREDGSLKIIDRKKDLIKLSHGEYVSLGRVETILLTNPLVDNICVYGNSKHDYLIAMVVPNVKNLQKLAQENGISGSWEELCSNKELPDMLAKELASFVAGKLSRIETPQKLILCPEPWTSASGLLTEALKLKRRNVEKAFEAEIKQLYT